MPNHVYNELVFSNLNTAEKEKLKSIVLNTEGKVDFNVLLPVPLNYWAGSVGAKHYIFPGNALDWCSKNWSTKWNAYGNASLEESGDKIVINFKTAWSPPMGWMCAVYNSGFNFTYTFLSEGSEDAITGFFRASEFDGWNQKVAETSETKRMNLLLWGE